MSNGIIASLFRKKSIREAAEKNISLSQAKPKVFSEDSLTEKLRNENQRLIFSKQNQEETINLLRGKIEKLEGEVPTEVNQKLQELQNEIDQTNIEIKSMKEKYKEISKMTQKNSQLSAQMSGFNFSQLKQQRIEKMNFMQNPSVFLEESRKKLHKKKKKLQALNEEIKHQTEIEDILITIEREYDTLQKRLKQLEEREKIHKELEDEEKTLENQLNDLQKRLTLHNRISELHQFDLQQDNITKSLSLIAKFAADAPNILQTELNKVKK